MDGIPLIACLNLELVPLDLLQPDGDLEQLLERVLVTTYEETIHADESITMEYGLSLGEEVSFGLVGIDGIQLVFGGPIDAPVTLTWIGGKVDQFATSLLGEVHLRFDQNLFVPVIPNGRGFVPDPAKEHFSISLAGGVEFDHTLAVTFSPDVDFQLTPVMIGNTGLVIEGQMALDLSEQEALPQSVQMGLDASWKGVVFDSLQVHLPDALNVPILPNELVFENFHIGNGGLSGSITGNWDNGIDAQSGVFTGNGVGDIFGLSFALKELEITLAQNTLTASHIKGSVMVPFFDTAIDVIIGLTNDGDVTISVDSSNGLLTLDKPDVLSIDVNSLEFVKEDGLHLFKISGSLTPKIGGLAWPSFDLQSLTIGSDGSVKVEGGWLELPEMKTLDFHGFKVEISQIGFGTDKEGNADFNWVGFTGGIQIVGSLPLRGGVEGLKVMWDKNTNDSKLKIGGVSLGFEIDNMLAFDGTAYFIDEVDSNNQPVRGFKGGFDVSLVPLNGAGFDAQFVASKVGSFNAFYLFLDARMPMGVPILPPAVGLYGLSGLFGYNMTLDYQQLVSQSPLPEMTDITHWPYQEGAMAFGAGVTVGTLPDNGFTAKGKVLFVMLVPGPVILIEGQAKILSLDEPLDYPYSVLAVLDVGSGSFLMNIGTTYSFPKKTGDLLDIGGNAEAFFSAGDLNGWHLHLGQKSPDSQRIRADVLSFFKAEAYLMVDQKGLDFGVWIGYSLDKRFGPLRVILEAWISGGMAVSWMPLQAKGSISLFGRAELSAFGIGLGISVEATTAVEVPKPLSLTGKVKVQLKTPLGNPKATVEVKWEKDGKPSYPIPLAKTLGIEHRKVTENWDVVKSSKYGVDDDGLWDESAGGSDKPGVNDLPVVPPDVQLVLNFDKSVVDAGLVGGNNPDVPKPEQSGAYEFEYELNGISLEYSESYDSASWDSFDKAGTDYVLTAAWQAMPDPDGMVNTKLLINAQSSLEIARVLDDSSFWMYMLSLYNPDYPCIDPVHLQWSTANVENYTTGEDLYPRFIENGWIFSALYPMIVDYYHAPWLGTDHALSTADRRDLTRCLLIPEQPSPSGQVQTLTIGDLTFHACSDPNGSLLAPPYVELQDGCTWIDYERTTQLVFDKSVRDPVRGISPANIEFSTAMGAWPTTVWLTLMVEANDDTRLRAFDEFGNFLDEIDEFAECRRNPHTYELKSSTGNPIRRIQLIDGNYWQIMEICWVEHDFATEDRISVVVPETMNRINLDFGKSSSGTIELFNKVGAKLKTVQFNVPDDGPSALPEAVSLDVKNLNLNSLTIKGDFTLIQVEGLPQSSVDAVVAYEEQKKLFKETLEENWGKHTAQILLPNKYYRLKIDTTTKRKKKSNDSWTSQPFTEYMYFRTGDPVGLFNSNVPVALDPADSASKYPAAGPLKDLTPYIQATIPASAPPNEAQVLHYRSYDVGCIFNDSYIEQMYHAANHSLGIKLLDNNMNPVLDENGNDTFINGWGDNTELVLTEEENLYQTLWDVDCTGISTVDPEVKQELIARAPHLSLKPRTQYKAQVWADNAYMLYEFAFMTSKYASFMHQMHDFQDAVWDLDALQANPGFSVDTATLSSVLNNGQGNEEWVQFEQLMMLFDLNPRPLPQCTEIALLNDANGGYGLLVESPEPMSADRVTDIELSISGDPQVIAEFNGPVKLVRATSALVEVLLMEAADVSGYSIEYRNENDPEETSFTPYFTFPAGSSYPAGTRLIVLNGQAPAESSAGENITLHAGHTATSISYKCTEVRLLDAEVNILHERLFLKNNQFNAQSIRTIRSKDATRMFLFIEDGSTPYSVLANGAYRLSLTYLRNAGNEHILLRRHGFKGAENVQMEFSLPALLPG